MTREIKFRAWDKKQKCYFANLQRQYFFKKVIELFNKATGRFVVEQYTGLKDKTGKEIYEGDIVKFEDAIFAIGWNNKHARFGFDPIKGCDISMNFSMKECEVIGNIHENPELLYQKTIKTIDKTKAI